MGNRVSALLPCVRDAGHPDLLLSGLTFDETLGHSFCYVRHNKLSSPSASGRFSPSSSGRFVPETTFFHSISGASVSANSSAPVALFPHPLADANAAHCNAGGKNGDNFFVGSSFFSSIPLQPMPRVVAQQPNQDLGNSGRFERGFLSGPLERGVVSGPFENSDNSSVHISAPLGGYYKKKKKKKKKKRKALSGVAIKQTFGRGFSEKKRPWVFPVLSFVGLHHSRNGVGYGGSMNSSEDCSGRFCENFMEEEGGMRDSGHNLQWAHGKAGEDRVHLVVSEDIGWLFVGIYDGFNGPDAPEFLMANLYKAVFDELEGLFWEGSEDFSSEFIEEIEMKNQPSQSSVAGSNQNDPSLKLDEKCLQDRACGSATIDKCSLLLNGDEISLAIEGDDGSKSSKKLSSSDPVQGCFKKVTFKEEALNGKRGKLLKELLAEEDDDAFSFWGSGGPSKGVAGQLVVNKNGDCEGLSSATMNDRVSANSDLLQLHGKRSSLVSKLKRSFNKQMENARKSSRWSRGFNKEKSEMENQVGAKMTPSFRKCKASPVDHGAVLKALSNALETTETAYLDVTDKAIHQNPELALTGSCLLVVLMKDEDVYVMNVGDSRAIVAQSQLELDDLFRVLEDKNGGLGLEGILEDGSVIGSLRYGNEIPMQEKKLIALQLSTDHSTSIEEEVLRIKREHPDDSQCIVNDRVKGRLKVTRAFGAGFLKQAKWNDALLEMFRNEYIGTAPYISCSPSLCHHRLGATDQFLVLSSDGLYQYLSNEEVVSYVENFMEKFPDGDPAQYLLEELLFRAAKKAGMEFHELLDIPQGDRRKYHDDVTVMVISLEGRIWKSSGKY